MKTSFTKFASFLLALVMCVGVIAPTLTHAISMPDVDLHLKDGPSSDRAPAPEEKLYPFDGGKIIIDNGEKDSASHVGDITGATYRIYQTHKMLVTGQMVALDKPVQIGEDIVIQKGEKANIVTVSAAGRYKIEQIKRAPGMYLGQGYKDKEQTQKYTDDVTVDFPVMENGVVSGNQERLIQPKVELVKVPFGFVKTNGANKKLSKGITFKIKATKVSDNAKAINATLSSYDTEMTVNGDGVFMTNKPLVEGEYDLIETNTNANYPAKQSFKLVVKAKAGKEDTAESADDIAFFLDGVDVTPTKGETGEMIYKDLKNEFGPTPVVPGDPDDPTNEPDPNKPLTPGFNKTVAKDAETVVTKKADNQVTLKVTDSAFYTINIRLPKNISKYHTFSFEDVVDSRIKLKGNATLVEAIDGITVETSGQTIKGVVASPYGKTALDGKLVQVKFEAVVQDTAKNGDVIKNNVTIKYNPFGANDGEDPENPGTPVPDTEKDIPEDDQPKVNVSTLNLTIKAVDGDNNTPLNGGEYKVVHKDDEGNVIEEVPLKDLFKIEKDGKTVITNLITGKYEITSETAPEGYPNNGTPQEITLTEDGEVVFKYYKTKTDLPTTGTLGMLPYLAGAAAVGIPGLLIFRKKKEDEEEAK